MSLGPDESLATVEQADAYAAARNWTDWLAADVATKEACLRQITDYICVNYTWPDSWRTVFNQILPWPRSGAFDNDYRLLTGTPDRVVAATIEGARLFLTGPIIGGEASQVLKSEKAGDTGFEYQATSVEGLRAERLAWIDALLRFTGAQGGGNWLTMRAVLA